jgi:hypothetical protein
MVDLLRKQLPIVSACPLDEWPRLSDETEVWHCPSCSKSVLLLSNMTQADAREALSSDPDAPRCVAYRSHNDGRVSFRSRCRTGATEPAPKASRRSEVHAPTSPLIATWVLTSTLLASCAPHGSGDTLRVQRQAVGLAAMEARQSAAAPPPSPSAFWPVQLRDGPSPSTAGAIAAPFALPDNHPLEPRTLDETKHATSRNDATPDESPLESLARSPKRI